jgi:hypothetical protein
MSIYHWSSRDRREKRCQKNKELIRVISGRKREEEEVDKQQQLSAI